MHPLQFIEYTFVEKTRTSQATWPRFTTRTKTLNAIHTRGRSLPTMAINGDFVELTCQAAEKTGPW